MEIGQQQRKMSWSKNQDVVADSKESQFLGEGAVSLSAFPPNPVVNGDQKTCATLTYPSLVIIDVPTVRYTLESR